MADVNLTGQGQVAAQGITVDASGNVNVDGVVGQVVNALNAKAPQALKQLEAAAIATTASYAATLEGLTQAAAFLTSDGATLAAVSAAAPVAAAVFAVPALLLTLDPAKGGAGCCGTDTSKPYGQCSPAMFDWYGPNGPGSQGYDGQWTGSAWTGAGPSRYVPSSPAEQFIVAYLLASFAKENDCWHYWPPAAYVSKLAEAVAAWNGAHLPTTTATITRMVNLEVPETFAGQTSLAENQPASWGDPIAVALNMASSSYTKDAQGNWLLDKPITLPGALASFTVNTGPAIPTGSLKGIPTIKLGGSAPAGGGSVTLTRPGVTTTPPSTAAKMLALTGGTIATALGLAWLAWRFL